ncbi:MAG TPA: hypothetical protein VFH40_10210 [Gemmatimonadales bacterium]|jgi:hypothetical protein|nr:hypothetical protein [Gemmatimonadales bacterium]
MILRRLHWAGLLCGTMVLPSSVEAQRTGDQARLIFSLSGGVVGGKRLWNISPQPIQPSGAVDTFAVARRIRSNLVIGFSGTYYPGAHLGLMLEGFLVGLGFEDSCNQLFSTGSSAVASACTSIQGAEKAATSVILSAGPVFRINSQSLVSPYARLGAGLIFSNQSSLSMSGTFESGTGPVSLPVYTDDHESRVEPAAALGVGFTAAVAKGYQLRWELRDNLVGVQRVTAPSVQSGVTPPHELDFKHLFSLTIGVDVVLERRRGRRY